MQLGGLVGAAAGFFMQYWVSAVAYPVDVGGRPPNSWPVFIPIAFELGVLAAAAAGFLGVFVLCRLPRFHHPRFHHPLFAAPLFARVSTDGFYLCVAADDPVFDRAANRTFLAGLNPTAVEEVSQ